MNYISKRILSFMLFALSLVSGYSQHITFESSLGAQNYSGTISQSGFFDFRLGYQMDDKWSFAIDITESVARYNIRMPNAKVSSINWIGAFFNVLTVSNSADWTNKSWKEVYKGYTRSITSVNLIAGYNLSNSFRISAGPSIQFNELLTESTNEVTFDGSLFSDLEFDDYTNFGIVTGLDYICNFNNWSYLTLGVNVQSDLFSTSNKVSGSRFKGSSITYGVGVGINIGKPKEDSDFKNIEIRN